MNGAGCLGGWGVLIVIYGRSSMPIVLIIIHSRSRMTIDPSTPAAGRSLSVFRGPGR